MIRSEQVPLDFEFQGDKTFSNFFSGCHQEILFHLKDSITGKGEQQIFLWGEHRLGKSHLLQACCQQAHQQNKTSFYLPLQRLPDLSILENLEEIEVVCVDDIDKIAQNSAWEFAFFDFFNRLRDKNHQLIVSSNTAATELNLNLADLKTRLSWGLNLQLHTLTDEQMIAALSHKARYMGFEINDNVGQFLLSYSSRDISNLWDLLDTLDHESLAAKRKLTIPFLRQVFES